MYEWRHAASPPFKDSDYFEFANSDRFALNVEDHTAMVVHVPDVRIGDELAIQMSGYNDNTFAAPGVSCELQIYVTTYGTGLPTNDTPISDNGSADVPTTLTPDALVTFGGSHRASNAGLAVVRVFGRVSEPGHRCAFGGSATLHLEHKRVP